MRKAGTEPMTPVEFTAEIGTKRPDFDAMLRTVEQTPPGVAALDHCGYMIPVDADLRTKVLEARSELAPVYPRLPEFTVLKKPFDALVFWPPGTSGQTAGDPRADADWCVRNPPGLSIATVLALFAPERVAGILRVYLPCTALSPARNRCRIPR
jgi:hypothetical protein